MNTCNHIVLMALYNEWMNAKLYGAAGSLFAQELAVDRKVFFGSITGTLNHILVARYDLVKAVRNAPIPSRSARPGSRFAVPCIAG